jgi:hypothetical protein
MILSRYVCGEFDVTAKKPRRQCASPESPARNGNPFGHSHIWWVPS